MKRTLGLLTIAAMMASLAGSAFGAAGTWSVATGNWNVASNWSGGVVPSAGSVTINNNGTATLDSAVPSITYLTMGTSVGTGALVINSGADLTLTSATGGRALTIGSTKTSTVTQTGGTVTATAGDMILGYTSGTYTGACTYSISGGSLSVGLYASDAQLANMGIGVGRSTNGELNVSGTGVVSTTGHIVLGVYASGTTNAVTVADSGSLSTSLSLQMGLASSTNTIDVSGGTLAVGTSFQALNGTNTVNLSGGAMNVGTTFTMSSTSNTVNITGGTLTVSNTGGAAGTTSLDFGSTAGTNALTISSGSLNSTGGFKFGNGTIVQSDGSLSASDFYLAANTGSATYTMTGGSVTAPGYFDVGRRGTGQFDMSGASVLNVGYFRVGTGVSSSSTATGTANINGGSITANTVALGRFAGSTGIMVQTAGTVAASNVVIGGGVYQDTQGNTMTDIGTGSYTISGGSLSGSTGLQLGYGVSGTLDIANSATSLSFGAVGFGSNAHLSAVAGSSLLVNGNTGANVSGVNILLSNSSTSSANLAGLANMTFVFAGGALADAGQMGGFEVAGADLGAVDAGWVDNFAMGTLQVGDGATVGNVKLIDLIDNTSGSGAEALYLDSLIVTAGSTLDLNGLNVYVKSIQNDGTILGSVTVIPEPATMALLIIGGGLLAVRNRRKVA